MDLFDGQEILEVAIFIFVLALILFLSAGCGRIEDHFGLRPHRFRCNENVFCYCVLNNGKQEMLYCTDGVHEPGVPNE